MTRLHGRRGEMARDLFVSLLREHGPLTNTEIAEAAHHEAGIYLGGWNVHPHMLKLERADRVYRVQLARNHTILWAATGCSIAREGDEDCA